MEITAKTLECLPPSKQRARGFSARRPGPVLSGLYRGPLPQLSCPTPGALRGQRDAGGAPRAGGSDHTAAAPVGSVCAPPGRTGVCDPGGPAAAPAPGAAVPGPRRGLGRRGSRDGPACGGWGAVPGTAPYRPAAPGLEPAGLSAAGGSRCGAE